MAEFEIGDAVLINKNMGITSLFYGQEGRIDTIEETSKEVRYRVRFRKPVLIEGISVTSIWAHSDKLSAGKSV